ncbi:MAG: zf-HC2 domain-containing protein [Terracidiphilus sp.]
MNSNTQLDLHPDAERLNAFAEQALPERERGPILEHLAECGRCRQVVYLARQAAEMEMEGEPELAVAVAAPRSAATRESWFRNWRLAWASAGVLVVAVTVAYFVQTRRAETAAEKVKVAHEAAARNEETASMPPPPSLGSQAAQPPAPAPAHVPPVNKRSVPETSTVTPKQLPLPAGEASAMSSASGEDAAPEPGASGAVSPAMSASAAAPARRAETNDGTMTAAAPSAQIEAQPARAGSFNAGVQHKASGAFAASRVKPAELPSGLPAVSTAKAQGSTLAVDRTGLVFLSEDSGRHWESIALQWSGRAVAIRVEPVVGANENAEPSAAVIFEIVNDQGQVWLSTDGRNWKAK